MILTTWSLCLPFPKLSVSLVLVLLARKEYSSNQSGSYGSMAKALLCTERVRRWHTPKDVCAGRFKHTLRPLGFSPSPSVLLVYSLLVFPSSFPLTHTHAHCPCFSTSSTTFCTRCRYNVITTNDRDNHNNKRHDQQFVRFSDCTNRLSPSSANIMWSTVQECSKSSERVTPDEISNKPCA